MRRIVEEECKIILEDSSRLWETHLKRSRGGGRGRGKKVTAIEYKLPERRWW